MIPHHEFYLKVLRPNRNGADLGGRAGAFATALSSESVHLAFGSSWYLKAHSKQAALRHRFDVTALANLSMWSRYRVVDSIWNYKVGVWNGLDDENGASLSARLNNQPSDRWDVASISGQSILPNPSDQHRRAELFAAMRAISFHADALVLLRSARLVDAINAAAPHAHFDLGLAAVAPAAGGGVVECQLVDAKCLNHLSLSAPLPPPITSSGVASMAAFVSAYSDRVTRC